jgi:hypothetical protein
MSKIRRRLANGGGKATVPCDTVGKRIGRNGKVTRTADDFAERITSAWQKAVASIIETGRLLIEAKNALDHGEFGKMIEDKLPFGWRTAQRLMEIAEHPILSKATHVSHLPPSWGTLYELTKLPERELTDMLADGRINCETERKEVEQIADKIRLAGLYLYERVPESLNVLIAFMRKWPDASTLASHVLDDMEEGDHALDLDDVIKLSSWVAKLQAACRQGQSARDAESAAWDAERQSEGVSTRRKIRKRHNRAAFARQAKRKGATEGEEPAALRLLAGRDSVHQNRVDIALEWIFDNEDEVNQANEFFVRYNVVKHHSRRQGIRFVARTRYTARLAAPNNLASYPDRPSKINGKPCLRIEMRITGIQALQRAGITCIQDLINLDHKTFWQQRLRMCTVDMRKLGRIYNETRRNTKQVTRHRQRRFTYDLDVRVAQILMRTSGMQRSLDEYMYRRWRELHGNPAARLPARSTPNPRHDRAAWASISPPLGSPCG